MARAQADSAVERFYKGNQVRLIGSAGPGSGYSAWTRFIGQYLGRHLPSAPPVMDMFNDKDFLADAAKQDYDVNPISGEDMTALIGELAKTPRHVIEEVAALIEPPAAK